jgi:hypothetical protein
VVGQVAGPDAVLAIALARDAVHSGTGKGKFENSNLYIYKYVNL